MALSSAMRARFFWNTTKRAGGVSYGTARVEMYMSFALSGAGRLQSGTSRGQNVTVALDVAAVRFGKLLRAEAARGELKTLSNAENACCAEEKSSASYARAAATARTQIKEVFISGCQK